jgi:glycerol uptake facilitator-like aquaporin
MKRRRVHVSVSDMPRSIGFYFAPFAAGQNTARVAHEKQSGACCAPQFALRRGPPWPTAAGYIAAQIIGAVAGVWAAI